MRSTYLTVLTAGLLLGAPPTYAADDWVVPNQYIVKYPAGDVATHNTGFYRSLHEIGFPFTSTKNYTSPLFPGTVIDSAKLSLEQLKDLPDVADAWPNTYIPPSEGIKEGEVELPESASASFNSRSTKKRDTVGYLHRSYRKAMKAPLEKRQGGTQQDYWRAIHGLTGVQRLHDAGVKGAGAKIAIVDTGFYVQHPALGGCIGPSCKIIDGWDFISNDSNPGTGAGEDSHGTTVAAVAAGKDSIITGVAPDAKLLLYKVIPDYGESQYTSDLTNAIDAILRAVEHGADVISHSIGSLVPWSIGPMQALIDNTVASGIIVTNAASNMGTDNVGTLADRGAAKKSLTIGNYGTKYIHGYEVTATSDGSSKAIVYALGNVAPSASTLGVQVVFASDGVTVADACTDTLPSSFAANKIVLVKLGDDPACTGTGGDAAERLKAIWDAGAAAVLAYGTSPYGNFQEIGNDRVAGFLHNQADADWILNKIAANKPVSITFPTKANYKVKALENSGALDNTTYPSSGSGPTYDLFMSLAVSAPGFNYLSASGRYDGYTVAAGTSFATPYVAGIAALYIGAKGGHTALGPAGIAALREKIITSGTPLRAFPYRGESFPSGALDAVWRQGAGLVNASNVFYTPVEITPAKLDLNDTVHFTSNRQITIKNTGTTPLTFTLSHEAALGSYILYPGVPTIPPFFGGPTYDPAIKATVTIPTTSVTIAGHGSASLALQFAYPSGLTSSRWPLYGGFIRVRSSAGDTFTVPYFGSAGSQKDLTLLLGPPDFKFQAAGTSITGSSSLSLTNPLDRPVVTVRLAIGSAQVRVDYVKTSWTANNWSYPPTPGANNFVANVYDGVRYFTQRWKTDVAKEAMGMDPVFFELPIDGTKSDGTKVPVGNYKVRVAVLKGFGNPTVEADWETWVSPVVTFTA
ncbi:subtilisin-like protein [Ascobolus immersus RN42]|uniref:Subtilisin-like protein n=1 Tax=Ascobolus immersus RN42 TaxID=1160509 RepID=A0A3N4IAV4_ASCIM|nr:subtilisin-like protein [Ascobolus immersus RN42]